MLAKRTLKTRTLPCNECGKIIPTGPSTENVLCSQCKRAAAEPAVGNGPSQPLSDSPPSAQPLRGFDSRGFVYEARSLQAQHNHDDSKVEVSQKLLAMMADALDEKRLVIAKKDRDAAKQDSENAELKRLLAATRKENEQLRCNKQLQVGGFRQ